MSRDTRRALSCQHCSDRSQALPQLWLPLLVSEAFLLVSPAASAQPPTFGPVGYLGQQRINNLHADVHMCIWQGVTQHLGAVCVVLACAHLERNEPPLRCHHTSMNAVRLGSELLLRSCAADVPYMCLCKMTWQLRHCSLHLHVPCAMLAVVRLHRIAWRTMLQHPCLHCWAFLAAPFCLAH